ncbi:hypothetical protein K1X84_10095 [bacterium]|nr:hypothetical protein [bacterium]
MNILKALFYQNSTKKKIRKIKKDIKKIIYPICPENFWIEWYGAYDIDPKNLVFWICVKSDVMKVSLKSNMELKHKLKDILIKHDYPESARPFVSIDFESQETVDRESDGNWYHHFK